MRLQFVSLRSAQSTAKAALQHEEGHNKGTTCWTRLRLARIKHLFVTAGAKLKTEELNIPSGMNSVYQTRV